jgi:hypothetical protein
MGNSNQRKVVVDRVKAHIETHIHESITANDIANACIIIWQVVYHVIVTKLQSRCFDEIGSKKSSLKFLFAEH